MDIKQFRTKIDLPGSTVDFFEYKQDGITYFYFDTSMCRPPDPMVNALLGLELLDNENKKLIMINHTIPNALFARLNPNISFEVSEEDNQIKIEFSYN